MTIKIRLAYVLLLTLTLCWPSHAQRARSFNLTVNINGSGSVFSDLPGIDCPGICQAKFNSGTTITLEARPDPSATFSGWGGACSGLTPFCVVEIISANTSVTATFSSGGFVNPSSGGFKIVDSNGKIVSTRNLEDGFSILIEYELGSRKHFSTARAFRSGLGQGSITELAFASTDCTGPRYIFTDRYYGSWYLDSRLAVLSRYGGENLKILYSSENPSLDGEELLSYWVDGTPFETGGCFRYWNPPVDDPNYYLRNGYLVQGDVSIEGWWAPPFRWR